jgi:hypothetical protein
MSGLSIAAFLSPVLSTVPDRINAQGIFAKELMSRRVVALSLQKRLPSCIFIWTSDLY